MLARGREHVAVGERLVLHAVGVRIRVRVRVRVRARARARVRIGARVRG